MSTNFVLTTTTSRKTRPVKRTALAAFQEEEEDEQEVEAQDGYEPPWKRSQKIALEDPGSRFKRLKAEGVTLAESEKFWQAIYLWNQALEIRPNCAEVLEMRAQAQMQVHEWDPAIESALKAIASKPLWWEAHQTLGRAYIGRGSVREGRRAFAIAVHLNPENEELRKEDLLWSQSLYLHILAEEEAKRLCDQTETTVDLNTVSEETLNTSLKKDELKIRV